MSDLQIGAGCGRLSRWFMFGHKDDDLLEAQVVGVPKGLVEHDSAGDQPFAISRVLHLDSQEAVWWESWCGMGGQAF